MKATIHPNHDDLCSRPLPAKRGPGRSVTWYWGLQGGVEAHTEVAARRFDQVKVLQETPQAGSAAHPGRRLLP